MFHFKIDNISSHIDVTTYNIIEIPETIDASYGKVLIKIYNSEKHILAIVKTGDSIKISQNILNKIYEESIIIKLTITINKSELEPLPTIRIANQIILNSVRAPYFSEEFDFSQSIYNHFCCIEYYFCTNDIIRIPVTFYDSTSLLQTSNFEHGFCDHFYVKIVSIFPSIDDNIYLFKCEETKVVYRNHCSVNERIFDIQGEQNFSEALCELHDKIRPILRVDSMKLFPNWIKHRLVHVMGSPLSGKSHIVSEISQIIGYSPVLIKFSDVFAHSASAMEKKLNRFVTLLESGDYELLHFENFDRFFQNIDVGTSSLFDHRCVRVFVQMLDRLASLNDKHYIIFLSTCGDIPIEVDQCVLVRHVLGPVSDCDRLAIINDWLPDIGTKARSDIMKLSVHMTVGHLVSTLKLVGFGPDQTIVDTFKSSVACGVDNENVGLEPVTWRDVGGQDQIIKEILGIVKLVTSQYKPIAGFKPRKSGILLHGEPGTGKTLIAKAVAYECSLNFISVKGPELLNMYVGQTEENVRSLFIRVRQMVPCLLFCDELDSLIPRRGFSGDSGGVMDRIVSQFAVEFDAINNEDEMRVIVMGATNRLDLIDPAMLRNGRFDRIFHVAGGLDKSSQLEILKCHTLKLHLDSNVDLEAIVTLFPDNMITGASIYGLVATAVMNAIKRTIGLIENHKLDSNCDLIVVEADFVSAIEYCFQTIS